MAPELAAHAARYAWIRASRFDRRFEMRGDDGTIHARLNFGRLIGREAIGRANGREWKFTTESWLRPCVRVVDAVTGTLDAEMTMRLLGWAGRGLLTFSDGRQFAWASTSMLTDRRWTFTDPLSGLEGVVFEKPLLRQAVNADLLCARLTIDPSFTKDHAAGLLAVFSMYLHG